MQIFFMFTLFVVNKISTDFLINEIGIYSLGDNIIHFVWVEQIV